MGPARRSTNLWHWKYEQVLIVRSLISWLWHSMGHRRLGKSTAVSIIFGQLFAAFLLHPSGYCAKAEAGGKSNRRESFNWSIGAIRKTSWPTVTRLSKKGCNFSWKNLVCFDGEFLVTFSGETTRPSAAGLFFGQCLSHSQLKIRLAFDRLLLFLHPAQFPVEYASWGKADLRLGGAWKAIGWSYFSLHFHAASLLL
jgi:hypothetical protein